MDVNLRQIRAFLAVVGLGGFTRAAAALNISQPALTIRIRQLEDQVGLRLFDRNTRSVQLTRVGQELLPVFQRLMKDFDGAMADIREFSEEPRGTIRVAVLPSFAAGPLPALIADFRARNPRVSFVLKDAVGKRVLAMVRNDEVDFGIGVGGVDEPDLDTIDVCEDRLVLVYPQGHAVGDLPLASVPVISHFPLVLMDKDTSVRRLVDEAFAAAGSIATPACEATYMSTAVSMVRAGLGLAILPASAIEIRGFADIATRPIDDAGFVRRIVIIKRRGSSLLPAVEEFTKALLAAATACPATSGGCLDLQIQDGGAEALAVGVQGQ
ncbi:LysR family transcriptional regulator [Azospirillum sp. B4]|uniref:LysR family transcriptional regulator n=1 Tax=Azospirillum sp. B4 TaxID=95605 RepID=UPI000348D5A3|nr:LysR family transcriptional regulator [Azospirillum sp. B4]